MAQKQRARKDMPSISIFDTSGRVYNLKDLGSNKITIVEFWFLGCYPCMLKMQPLQALYLKYKSNPQISFLTISRTDSSNIIPIQRHDTGSNYYKMYKGATTPDSLLLPVYFIQGCNEKNDIVIAELADSLGRRKVSIKALPPMNKKNCPEVIFGFSAYPTLLIYDKAGKLIYHKTGFRTSYEPKQSEEIEVLLKSYLASNVLSVQECDATIAT